MTVKIESKQALFLFVFFFIAYNRKGGFKYAERNWKKFDNDSKTYGLFR